LTQPPELSVILVAPELDTIRGTVRALGRQTARKRLELLFVGIAGEPLEQPLGVEGFAAVKVLHMPGATIAAAQAAAVRAASAEVVAFTEDHCFPAPDWAEALVDRHREPWGAVGPSMANANPDTAVSWANFLMKYGDWIAPVPPGPPRQIPGHNSSYKRGALLEYGDGLASALECETTLQWDLVARGHGICIEPRARAFHLNYSVLDRSALFRVNSARLFATHRRKRWSPARRLVYMFGSPLIPLVRTARVLRTIGRLGRYDLAPRILPALSVLLALDALGEMIGYAVGAGDAAQKLSDTEYRRERFLTAGDQQLAEDVDRILEGEG
jgi:hypothetical protein